MVFKTVPIYDRMLVHLVRLSFEIPMGVCSMKKFWYASVILIPLLLFAFFTSCATKGGGYAGGTGSFTYDGQTYPLAGAGFDIYSDWFEVDLASSGINVSEWTGSGQIIWFELISPSTQGAPGTYTWNSATYELWDGGISLDYTAYPESGTYLWFDYATANSGDYVSISVSGSTYTIEFSVLLQDGNTVTGSYPGAVIIW